MIDQDLFNTTKHYHESSPLNIKVMTTKHNGIEDFLNCHLTCSSSFMRSEATCLITNTDC